MYRIPLSFKKTHDLLLRFCAFAPNRPLQSRAHQLLALELTSFLKTTEWDYSDKGPSGICADPAFRSLADGAGAPGGPQVADFYRVYGSHAPYGYPGGAVPQVPGPIGDYNNVVGYVVQATAQLAIDVAAAGGLL